MKRFSILAGLVLGACALFATIALTANGQRMPQSASGAAKRAACDVQSPLIRLKVSRTSCDVGKAKSLKMRSYIVHNQDAFDQNGYYHLRSNGWGCHARFVGSDEVLMGCQKRIPRSTALRRINSLFYWD